MKILQTRKRLILTITKLQAQNRQDVKEWDEKLNEMQLEIESLRMHADIAVKKLKDEVEFLEKIAAHEEEDWLSRLGAIDKKIDSLKAENEELLGYKNKYISFIKNRRIR